MKIQHGIALVGYLSSLVKYYHYTLEISSSVKCLSRYISMLRITFAQREIRCRNQFQRSQSDLLE